MGNVRTKDIKKASHELIKMYPDKFNEDFENNKQVLQELKLIDSKIVRNKIGGYITSLKKQRRRSSS
jgi:small subunit ribosomal protein S17e